MDFCKKITTDLRNCFRFSPSDIRHMVLRPGRDFTRKRKLSLDSLALHFLSLQSSDLGSELSSLGHFHPDSITASGFRQQRDKLQPDAMKLVFHRFRRCCERHSHRTLRGLRVFACDGSDFAVVANPRDADSYFLSNPKCHGHNLVHVNALYDVLNHLYVDLSIYPRRLNNERRAALELIPRAACLGRALYLFDRGYEGYAVPLLLEQLGQSYLIRVQGPEQNSILKGIRKDLEKHLHPDGTFDVTFTRHLKKQKDGHYSYLAHPTAETISLTFRAVRVHIPGGKTECLLTNLPKTMASQNDLKELYRLRWGIETSFRHLKYDIGGRVLHARDFKHYVHELYASFLLYNYCSLIIHHYNRKYTRFLAKKKHTYRINFRQGIRVCRQYLKDAAVPVERMLLKHVVAIRKDRPKQERKTVGFKGAVGFLYRM